MNDIFKVIKTLENLGVLIGGISVVRNFRCFNIRKYLNWKR